MDLPGFYGKVPSLGDFVTRRLPRGFIEPWDQWLMSAIAETKSGLGESWLDVYLTSPIWRFVLPESLCGPRGWAGVVMPSVDRVGRCFPLTLTVQTPQGGNLFTVAGAATAWFQQAEEVVLTCLEEEDFALESFDASVQRLGPLAGQALPAEGAAALDGADGWWLDLEDVDALAGAYPGLLHELALARFGPYSLWWTAGSDRVAPGARICAGMPAPHTYLQMLDAGAQPESALAQGDAGVDPLEALLSEPGPREQP